MSREAEIKVSAAMGLAWLYHCAGQHKLAIETCRDAAHLIRFVRRPLALLQLDRELLIIAQEIADGPR